eukprot:scaffold103001_cov58-Attheya_sp.AAC.5
MIRQGPRLVGVLRGPAQLVGDTAPGIDAVASSETGWVGLIGAVASGETGLVDLIGSVASGKVGKGCYRAGVGTYLEVDPNLLGSAAIARSGLIMGMGARRGWQ